MNDIDKLYIYKKGILDLCENIQQKRFLESSFSRWYFLCSKTGITPLDNIVIRTDLEYGNLYKSTNFNITNFMRNSSHIFKQTYNARGKYLKNPRLNICSSYKIITPGQFGRMQKLYNGSSKDFYDTLDNLVTLYEIIGINNIHLSIPPIFKGVELFGSPLNTHNREYCSPFEIEKLFCSLGSFWDYTFHRDGIYICNPPFDENFIYKMANKLICDISSTNYKVLIVITIPLWDSNSQNENSVKDFNLELRGLNILTNSSYLKDRKILNKQDYPYWNYYTEEYVHACWTHLLVISNLNNIFYRKNFNINNLLNLWKSSHR